MKIVNVIGGLGNQMFQYAFACYLKHQFPNEEILLDTHHFAHYKLHNGYELNHIFPNLTIPIAGKEQIKKVTRYIPHYKLSRLVRKLLPVLKTEYLEKKFFALDEQVKTTCGALYYEGYWQAWTYCHPIKAQLLQAFCFANANTYNVQLTKNIRSTHSVGIHIRRGDYLNLPSFQGICELEYYQRAINNLLSTTGDYAFFIFSNDIDWCKENIQPLLQGFKIHYVNGNRGEDSCWDMYLMSQCENLIIANSTFSWWGAFLNQQAGRVYAPKRWINGYDASEIYDRDWIVM